VAHLLHTGNKDVSAFLGGICLNFGSNYIDGNTYAVAEADEFDRSFLQLTPNIALVTSVDTDHLDIYGNFEAIQDSFKAFLSQVREGGKIILHQNVDQKIVPENHKVLTYSYQDTQSDYFAQNIKVIDGATHFELNTPNGIIKNLILNYGGKHNAENAIGASAIALSVGVSEEDLRKGLATFLGVRRRFQTAFKSDKYVLIDDYAHHPREIDAVIQTVRDLYPNKKLTVIFQPHLFSRTKDLAIEFGQSLSAADQVYLLPIYPARELPMEGVTSDLILNAIAHNNKKIIDKSSILDSLKENAENEIIMTAGAGDIDTMTSIIANWLKSIS
jgi:UDP-N-acetylmuramate--alanine ligase